MDLEEEVEKFLPKFKKKGRDRIVEISSGKFREWPRRVAFYGVESV